MAKSLRRTILFVPGNNERMMEKASILPADMIILDCEDSVPPEEKLVARQRASQAIGKFNWGQKKEVGIRINGLDTHLWADDLKTALSSSPDFIVVPKIEEGSEVKMIDRVIRSFDHEEAKTLTKIIVAVENAKGLTRVEEIVEASDLITSLEFGAEDYSLSLGILSTQRSEQSSLYARSRAVAAARAHGIDALDQAFVNLVDLQGLRRSAVEAKNLGFTGKSVIHPNQIEIVNEVFSPSAEDISWAHRILDAWGTAKGQGKGAFRFEDKMVDAVHIKMAEKILRIADELGKV